MSAPSCLEVLICGFYKPPVSRENPWFSAICTDTEQGRYYQIQISSISGDFGTPVWDSAKTAMNSLVQGKRSIDVTYAGTNYLTFGCTYYVRMRFWDTLDDTGGWNADEYFYMREPADAIITWKATSRKVGYGMVGYGLSDLGYGGGDLDSNLLDAKIEVYVGGTCVSSYLVSVSSFSVTKMCTFTYVQSANIAENGRFRSALAFCIKQRNVYGLTSDPIWIYCNTP